MIAAIDKSGACVEPLLSEPWILDVDTTVKPLYGHDGENHHVGIGLRQRMAFPAIARADGPQQLILQYGRHGRVGGCSDNIGSPICSLPIGLVISDWWTV